jgi:site-specific DNA-methyltransferase (adenine-specific)
MIKLINDNALVALDNLEGNSVDLTVTSPPYDNLRTYNGNNDQWGESVWKSVIKKLYTVTKEGGVVVWIVGDATIKGSETGTSFKQALWAMECGFNLHDTMIYQKTGFPFPMKNRYYQSFEYMFVLSKGIPQTVNQISDRKNIYAGGKVARNRGLRMKNGEVVENSANRIDKNRVIKDYGVRFNIWKVTSSSSKGDKLALKHPATFPEQLAHDHILSWSNEGDTVLDCFMGSGTTGKMAKQLGRNFVGIEMDETYFNIAKDRIESHQIQANLI